MQIRGQWHTAVQADGDCNDDDCDGDHGENHCDDDKSGNHGHG